MIVIVWRKKNPMCLPGFPESGKFGADRVYGRGGSVRGGGGGGGRGFGGRCRGGVSVVHRRPRNGRWTTFPLADGSVSMVSGGRRWRGIPNEVA